jgi:hypothetical protein
MRLSIVHRRFKYTRKKRAANFLFFDHFSIVSRETFLTVASIACEEGTARKVSRETIFSSG